ncbi:MAG: hypothetical protein JW795_18890 [Chitinivibrionales bacterium]|nr:hypothetical protein [Chitinivibrionales bacterium]
MFKQLMLIAACITVVFSSASALEMGLEFKAGAQNWVGANLRFSDFYELKPSILLLFSDDENYNTVGVCADNNFYLPELKTLQQYAGFTIGYGIPNYLPAESFFLGGHYGLRYNLTEDIISIFGEVGFLQTFDPVIFSTLTSSLGVTFYLPMTF